MAWYYARGEERMGPVEDDEFLRLAASGAVTSQTLVWKEGMTDWQPYASVAPDADFSGEVPLSVFGDQTVQACAECGRTFASDDMITYERHWVCSECKDIFFQRIREGGVALASLNYAGFWIRFCARVIDGFIMGFVGLLQNIIQGMLTGGFGFNPAREPSTSDYAIIIFTSVISMAIGIGYEIFFVGKYGATPGKMVFGLKVVMSDGGRVSYGRSTGRYFATWLSSMTLLIGYIMAAFDSEKRSLHDHICDTRVIRK